MNSYEDMAPKAREALRLLRSGLIADSLSPKLSKGEIGDIITLIEDTLFQEHPYTNLQLDYEILEKDYETELKINQVLEEKIKALEHELER